MCSICCKVHKWISCGTGVNSGRAQEALAECCCAAVIAHESHQGGVTEWYSWQLSVRNSVVTLQFKLL